MTQPPIEQIVNSSARFVKQSDFVPYDKAQNIEVCVIGVGAIGREVTRMLAAIGIMNITIIDFDTVEHSNVTTQGYLMNDIGKAKVDACVEMVNGIDPLITVKAVNDRFRPKMKLPPIVFMCVDSIKTRELIWKALKNKGIELLVDGRMLGEIMRVVSVNNEEAAKHFEATFFPEEEGERGRCTAHATIYCASAAAGLMVHQYTRHMRGFPLDNDMSLNLLAGELFPVNN